MTNTSSSPKSVWSQVAGSLAALAGLGVLFMATGPAFAATIPDFSQYGFPTVVAKASVSPTVPATVTAGDLTVTIPAGTFSSPVTFQILENQNSYWQAKAPTGQTVIANFAFRVMNTSTNQLVGAFNGPVMLKLTNEMVVPSSVYDNASTTGTLSVNPIPSAIVGDTLTHPIKAAVVGWIITSPTAGATSPTTGLPVLPVMAGGAVLLGMGIYLVRRPGAAR